MKNVRVHSNIISEKCQNPDILFSFELELERERDQAKVHTALAMPTTTIATIPNKALLSAKTPTAPFDCPLPDDDEPDEEEEPDEPEPDELPDEGEVGVNVPEALERHELAAELAAETVVGELGFTVALPAKSHEVA